MKFDGKKLLRRRELLGYGLEKAAQEAGVSKNSVLRAEHGGEIRPVTARKIAGGLGIEVADLLEREDPKAEAPSTSGLPDFYEEWRSSEQPLEEEWIVHLIGVANMVESFVRRWKAERLSGFTGREKEDTSRRATEMYFAQKGLLLTAYNDVKRPIHTRAARGANNRCIDALEHLIEEMESLEALSEGLHSLGEPSESFAVVLDELRSEPLASEEAETSTLGTKRRA